MSATSPELAACTGLDPAAGLVLADRYLTLPLGSGSSAFHYVWLRDNCWCAGCRVAQSGERRLFTADIAQDIAPVAAEVDAARTLRVAWNDGHSSSYTSAWLSAHSYSAPGRREPDQPELWDADLGDVPTFEHGDVVGTAAGQLAYLEAVRSHGVALVRGTPAREGEVARFAETLGHVRETAFERIHNVRHDPTGYNVAHTAMELKPHTDLPSYHWPPSVQLLHFLVNDAEGGESTVTDGWAVLAELRRVDPTAFETLTRLPVVFQLFSDTEDTYAKAPMIQLDPAGRVVMFRFSNQLAQPVEAAFADMEDFYDAYRTLGRLIDSGRHTVPFKTSSGDLLTVHGHRVLHGRLPFDPASGGRHLQDVYMEYDDLMSRRRVLLGQHKPMSAHAGA
ncbi:MAG: TauD/TfdA family dioxygenase [Nocardioidaceae bacterium]